VASRHFPIGVDHDLKALKKFGKSKSWFDSLPPKPFVNFIYAPRVPERSESRTFSILREFQPRQANGDSSDDPTFSDLFV
jgi:hypothetical protein